jgi:sugar phosphate isomerase/epimerase
MATNRQTLSLAHLTMLDVAPPDLVHFAAEAGFDAVGIRVQAAHPQEEPWPMLGDSQMMRDTEKSLRDEGISVLDVEVIRLRADTAGAEHAPILDAGARLGARFIIVASDDPDVSRAADNFATICDLASPLGILPVIEPMVYTEARTLDAACSIAARNTAHPGGVLIDSLHLHRLGARPQDLTDIAGHWLPYVQICDTHRVLPGSFDLPSRFPRNQSTRAEPVALEARAFRLLPGDGDLPLLDLLRVLPDHLPVSVEAPCYSLQQSLAPGELARRAAVSSRALLARA